MATKSTGNQWSFEAIEDEAAFHIQRCWRALHGDSVAARAIFYPAWREQKPLFLASFQVMRQFGIPDGCWPECIQV